MSNTKESCMPTISQQVQILTSDDGKAQLRVTLDQETVWLTQNQICELFARERSVVTKHIKNVFIEGELVREAACANFAYAADDGKVYHVQHYNFDATVSLSYRYNIDHIFQNGIHGQRQAKSVKT